MQDLTSKFIELLLSQPFVHADQNPANDWNVFFFGESIIILEVITIHYKYFRPSDSKRERGKRTDKVVAD